MGFASPYPTRGWDFPPRPRGPSCETSPRLGKFSRWPARAALIRPRSFASPNLRTIQRGGGDAVGLRLPKPSAAVSRLSRACRKTAALGFPRGSLRPLRFARALDLRSARIPSESSLRSSSSAHSGGRRPLTRSYGRLTHDQPGNRRKSRLGRPSLRFGYSRADEQCLMFGRSAWARESFPTPRSRPFGRLLRSRGIFPWCAYGRGRHGLDGGGGPVGCWGAFFGESQISNLKSQTGAGARGWHDRLTGAGRDGRQRTALDAVKWALV